MNASYLMRRWLPVGALTLAAVLWAAPGRAATVMNIEVDYMVGTHSHRPQADEVAAVVQMFACHGITLNIVVDDAIPHVNVMPRNPANGDFFNYTGTGGYRAMRNTYFDHDGVAGWHYCIFGHQYEDDEFNASGSSGLGEVGGDDFVVTLGSFSGQIGTPWDRASTLAHEFGHNLGLHHGEYGNYPVNKPSIMSYFYQLRGVRTAMLDYGLTTEAVSLFKELDYSDGRMISLNEAALIESRGTGMTPVDWNCSGTISGTVSVPLDGSRNWCNSTNTDRHVINDMNEWAALSDNTGAASFRKDLNNVPVVSCITSQEIAEFTINAASPQPPIVSESCVSARMIYLSPGGLVPSGNGTGANPYNMIALGQAAATSGSHLFLLPGTYTLDTGPLLLNKRMTVFSRVGTSVINP